ncbi:MAG: helix-turn-helix domain-containing protein [Lachnospiraceae bacterium]|nr:helix-turn-helix domain-containing protein [Lachnospiraceae bacterium]
MKYRNLNLTFSMENVTFTVLSISNELMLAPIPRHSHSRNSYEIHYISYGYGTLIADDARYDLTPGTFFMTGPQVFHEQISDPAEPMREYGAYLKVSLPRSKPESEALRAFLNHPFYIGQADLDLYESMKRLISELEQRPEGNELMLSAIFQQLIVQIARQYNRAERPVPETLPSPKNLTPGTKGLTPADKTYLTIEEAFLYNYRDLTLDSLAGLLNLSRRQTERLLLKHYNKTFQQKKKEARMSAACILLQSGDKSVASVAEELGYSSPEHFSNAFKKYYRMTPSAYAMKAGSLKNTKLS